MRKRSAARELIVRAATAVAPDLTNRALIANNRRHNERVQRRLGLGRIYKEMSSFHGQSILAGPFKGMKYTGQAVGSMATPKLVGSYELELHAVIESAISRQPARIFDIGVAEGYYAVGFAKRLPEVRIYAFDTDPVARRMCKAMAKLNDVDDRIEIRGRCDPEALNELLTPGSLLLSDCEGYEFELLDPSRVSALSRTDIIVEMHEHTKNGLTASIVERFKHTHQIELIKTVKRDPADYACLEILQPSDRSLALDELRHSPQEWAIMISKTRTS